ncbi:hypothetical protein [Paraglaciecola sp.]|uniref:hypothetical protein n=1 Tax=Paraglaciecola sp. TaxID=1920173 RepID=UPI003EF1E04E
MKRFLAFFLLITLATNAFSALDICAMEHDSLVVQAEPMPCHNPNQSENSKIESNQYELEAEQHLCDCDKCAQDTQSFDLSVSVAAIPGAIIASNVNHQSLAFSPQFRPPTQISI